MFTFLRLQLKAAMTRAVFAVTAALFLLGALGFALAAFYMWLATIYAAYISALIVAGTLILFALGALMLARVIANRQERMATVATSTPPEAGMAGAGMAAGAPGAASGAALFGVVDQALRAHPMKTLALALAAGLGAGIASKRKR